MEYVVVQCPSGHRLKAGLHLRGRSLPCPKCQAIVVVPQAKDELTDTGLMRILGDVPPLPSPPLVDTIPVAKPRNCPRCESVVSRERSVCPRCQCFIGAAHDVA